MKIFKLINLIKRKTTTSNIFNLGILLLPSAPSISSVLLLMVGIRSTIKEDHFSKDLWNFPFLISSFLILVSCVSNTLFREDFYKNEYDLKLIWLGVSNWIPYFWVFATFQRFSLNEIQRKRFFFFLLVGSIPVFITGLLQYFFKLHGPFTLFNGLITWYSRDIAPMEGMTGLFNNANYLGIWLNILWPFSIIYFLRNKEFARKRLLSLIFLLVIFTCTILTFSRNAWLGMLLGLILVIGVKSLRWIIPTLGLIFVPVLMGLGLFSEKLAELGQQLVPDIILNQFMSIGLENFSTFTRIQIWDSAINFIFQKPFFGWGSSSFPVLYGIDNNSLFYGHTHNLFLEISLSFGIPTAAIIISTILSIFFYSGKVVNKSNIKNREFSYDKAWWVSSLIIFFSHMFDLQYFDIRVGFVFWILLGGLRNFYKKI